MKKYVVLLATILVSLMFSISMHAQKSIGDFCGVRFGMSKSQVASSLNGKGVQFRDFTNYLYARNIYMGPIEFTSAKFDIDSSKGLVDAIFELTGKSTSFSQSAYDTLLSSLIDKYGSPSIQTNNTAKWNLSNGQILLRCNKQVCNPGLPGEHEEWCVFLSYAIYKQSNNGKSDL